jgi:hypothetical protein
VIHVSGDAPSNMRIKLQTTLPEAVSAAAAIARPCDG